MSFVTDRPLPSFSTRVTLRIFLAGDRFHRISTAVFYKGRVLQMRLLDPYRPRVVPGARFKTFDSVASWIQYVADIYECPLILEGHSDANWRYKRNNSILMNVFTPVTINSDLP
jgi:hypothetical protein